MNVVAQLAMMAQARPHALAVACPAGHDRRGRVAYTQFSFQELHEESERLARGLIALGIAPSTRLALMVPPSLDFFALTFALLRAGIVPVLVDPGMGLRQLGRCLNEAGPQAMIGIPKAHAARRVMGWGHKTIRWTITTGRGRWLANRTVAELSDLGERHASIGLPEPQPTDLAAILFTSGSTGIAKGVLYPHAIFSAQIDALRALYSIQPGEVDLCTFPLFALFAPALGMSAIIPEMDPTRPALVNPVKILDAIRHWGVTNLFGSPALLNRIGRYGVEHRVTLPSLRRVVSAGAPVPSLVVERIVSMLTGTAQVHTPYGATEALPVASIGSDEILKETAAATAQGAGICVGRPAPDIELSILPITDEAIATWDPGQVLHEPRQIGEIAVYGPVVTGAYLDRPEANRLAKVADRERGGVWHRMGDLGYLDEQGRLWFCGRKSHRVATPSGLLHSVPVEEVFNTHPNVYRSALVGVVRGGIIEPVLCVELERSARGRSKAEITRELLALGANHDHTSAIRTVLYHAAFPVDVRHNAKIFREKLALWAARQLR